MFVQGEIMQGAMQHGINSLPDVVKETNDEEADTDHEAEEDISDYFESGITDLGRMHRKLENHEYLDGDHQGNSCL
jgi:hypothetical protein